jgi:protein TonB
VTGRIDLVRQHYASSRVAGAQLELSATLDLLRTLLATENARPRDRSEGQLPRAGRDAPMPGLLERVEPEYPIEAARKNITGYVVVDAVIDKSGKVRDGRVVRSVPELDRAALDAVRRWRVARPRFEGAPADVAATFALAFVLRREATPMSELDLARFYVERRDYAAAEAPLGRALGAISREAACVAALFSAAGAQRRAGVSGSEQPRRIKDVRPVYPALAMKAKVTGTVGMEAVVGVDGRVSCVRVLKSIPLLDQAAVDAVSRWEFAPLILAGVPVPTRISAELNFTLK